MIRIDGPCLVEVKRLARGVGTGDSAQHLVWVHHRPQTRGMLVSGEGGFSTGVEVYHREALANRALVSLYELEEIVRLVQAEEADLEAFLRRRFDRTAIRNEPHFRPLD